MKHSKLEVLAEFGYSKDPFKGYYMETADSLRVKRLLKMGIESRAMISVVATWGQGKTTALDLAFQEIDATICRLITPDKERVVVSDIEKSLILGLSNESCKRTKEVRARQIRRIVGEAAKTKPVVLILEEAHRMCGQTLRALKTFREMEYHGMCPLFTVLFVGQYDPMRKRGVDEVRLRTDTVTLKGLTNAEAQEFISGTVGKHFDTDAAAALSRLPVARNFLDLQEAIVALMAKAMQYGHKKVTAFEVFDLYNGGINEVIKKAKTDLGELAKITGLSKPMISAVANNKQGSISSPTYIDASQKIATALREKLGMTEEPEQEEKTA